MLTFQMNAKDSRQINAGAAGCLVARPYRPLFIFIVYYPYIEHKKVQTLK